MLSSLCECDLHLNESSWWRHEVQSRVFKLRKAAPLGRQCPGTFAFSAFGSFNNQSGGEAEAADALSFVNL